VFAASSTPADGLRTAMLLSLFSGLTATVFLWLASRHVEVEERTRLERGLALGEAA